MRKWSDNEGEEFRNSDLCYGREYKPNTNKTDIAKIMIRGDFPETGKWGFLEESHEMAVVIRGHGFLTTKDGDRLELEVGDVVYVEPMKRFRWGGKYGLDCHMRSGF
jgi:mannose-6-phosphate isomerase-like protein (cupin superfamily)